MAARGDEDGPPSEDPDEVENDEDDDIIDPEQPVDDEDPFSDDCDDHTVLPVQSLAVPSIRHAAKFACPVPWNP